MLFINIHLLCNVFLWTSTHAAEGKMLIVEVLLLKNPLCQTNVKMKSVSAELAETKNVFSLLYEL